MNPIRILLVEDHHLVRAGIRSLLLGVAGVQVVGETGDGREALRLIAEVRPNVVLMDIALPGLNGLEATARAVKDFPNVRVIMLSMNRAEEYVLRALRCGAAGYLLKDNTPVELEQAIRVVARGETYLSPDVSKHVIAAYVQRRDSKPTSLERLTPRQREVLQLIAEGRSTKEIAKTLAISIKTVEMHRQQLREALDIHDTASLVRDALRMGVVSADK